MPLVPMFVAVVIALGGGTAALADSAKPGDALYPIDQWVERMQERLTKAPEAKAGLLAKFSEERAAELKALQGLDPSEWSEAMKAKFEERKQGAIERLATSIERVNAVQDKFEEKLTTAKTEAQKEAYQKVIEHLGEVIAKREARLDQIEAGEFNPIPIRARLKEWQRESAKEMLELHREVLKKLGEDDESETEDAKLPTLPIVSEQDMADDVALAADIKAKAAIVAQAMQDYWEQVSPWYPPKPVTPEPEPNWPPHLM